MRILQKYLPKTTSLYLLPALLFLALMGANIYLFRLNPSSGAPVASLSAKSDSNLSSANLLPVEKVKGLAEAEVPGTKITRIELESHGDRLVYEVSVESGKKLAFDAQTGDKLSDNPSDNDKPDDKSLPASFTPSIDFDIAREIALVQKPGGDISKIELNADNGDIVYSVYFTDGSHVDIAATDSTAEAASEGDQTSDSELPTGDTAPASPNTTESSTQSESSTDPGAAEQTDGSL